ncbi:TcpQ domain-containing protein [Vibrio aestuarianus]|uniref:Toxin co-regulated pilus biosynthesis protein Q C-terminal domain-containing protein n=1 Tax=Vibrio aestuarianus TaxID=28171 RepID=A0A9X4ESC8_9VIBR|nr:hypothetical protein [Vibrio aestuarianus]MDE1240606.1 hypothetical protein [Vibrio aestuarianus]MDE1262745.1 hypothetical protein [Vibrio aestuarianus]MDE1295118.1 hypothetical protein [Vibrio aestuarianus]MDE1334798.1 hypothetical protein [Vibrio aestuarianus]
MNIIKFILIPIVSIGLLPVSCFASSELSVEKGNQLITSNEDKNIELVIEEGASFKYTLIDFLNDYDYKIKWDTEDFISSYRVRYQAKDPIYLVKKIVSDIRDNGKKIKATVYRNKILVIKNEND